MLTFVTTKNASALLVAVLGATGSLALQAADQGTTSGIATFNAKGEVKNYKPDVVVWSGTFVGVSVTDSRKGPLHNSSWDCTGENVIQAGNSHIADGFCLITDPDGDTINLIWARTNVPGPVGEPKTKGTYVSGTGKYTGIQGYYTFACKQGGTICTITSGEYKIP